MALVIRVQRLNEHTSRLCMSLHEDAEDYETKSKIVLALGGRYAGRKAIIPKTMSTRAVWNTPCNKLREEKAKKKKNRYKKHKGFEMSVYSNCATVTLEKLIVLAHDNSPWNGAWKLLKLYAKHSDSSSLWQLVQRLCCSVLFKEQVNDAAQNLGATYHLLFESSLASTTMCNFVLLFNTTWNSPKVVSLHDSQQVSLCGTSASDVFDTCFAHMRSYASHK
uniref:Uncharacterized protein n=1 Tax=Glossina austeni TaxID=7395 RepID=A0A1A9UJN7_GLOAU